MPDRECVMDGLAGLFAPGLDGVSFRNRTAEFLRCHVPCGVVSFATLECGSRRLNIDFDPLIPGLSQGLLGFGQHMGGYPCFSFEPWLNGGRPFLRSDFLSDEEFYASPIYLEGFAKAGISDHAAMLVHADAASVFFIGMELLGGVFGPAQRDAMTLLQPHVINAFHLASEQTRLETALGNPEVFRPAGLSARQAEVLSLLAAGKSNAEVAELLQLRTSTVKAYVSALFDKLGVDNRHAAILRAQQLTRPVSEPAPGAGRLTTRAVIPAAEPSPDDTSRSR